MSRCKQSHNSLFKTPKIIDFSGCLGIHGNLSSLLFHLSQFSFSNSENSFSLTNAHDCWPGQGDFTLAWLLVFTRLVPRVHQMLIDAERPLNLPKEDGPLVNYFIMALQCWSTVELWGVLLPAHHSNPDNLVNKGHRCCLMRGTRTKERDKKGKATVEMDRICCSHH